MIDSNNQIYNPNNFSNEMQIDQENSNLERTSNIDNPKKDPISDLFKMKIDQRNSLVERNLNMDNTQKDHTSDHFEVPMDQENPLVERTWDMSNFNLKSDFMSDLFEKTIDQVYMLIEQENPLVERTWDMSNFNLNFELDFMPELYKSIEDQERSVFERIQNMDSIGIKHSLMYEILKQMDLDTLLTLCRLNKFSRNRASKFLSAKAKKNFPDLVSVKGLVQPLVIIERIKRVHRVAKNSKCILPLFKQEKACPTFEGTRQLEEYFSYRSTLIVWKELSKCIGENGPNFSKLKSLTDYQKEANQFSNWFDTHFSDLSQIESLDLSTKLLTSLPPEIGKLINLYDLNISKNYLTSLPPEIGKLINLINFYANENYLNSFPMEIINFTQLKYLILESNGLTSLPTEISNLSVLEWLKLFDNKLTSLPSEIGSLRNLQKLDIAYNKLTSLPPEISKLTNLQVLKLEGNNLPPLPLPEIDNLTNLRKLTT